MFNEVTLVGRLGKDPDCRMTQNQTPVCTLWMATSEVSVKDGNKTEHTEWHSVVVWGNQAEACKNYLHKGSMVFVKGRIQSREYQDKENIKRKQYDIIANVVKFLTPKKDATPQAPIDASSVEW